MLLIDEIDKADIEFPMTCCRNSIAWSFTFTKPRDHQGEAPPDRIITSNNEKELPDAFLRRCFFHYIRFPDAETMTAIVDVHFPDIKRALVREALKSSSRCAKCRA